MPAGKPRAKPNYPNKLRTARGDALYKQSELVALCEALANKEPTKYITISITSLSKLECGHTRPHPKRALTLATVLKKTIDELFPMGVEDFNHNPQGNTKIIQNRNRGGRPRSRKNPDKL